MKRTAAVLIGLALLVAAQLGTGRARRTLTEDSAARLADGILRISILGDSLAAGAGDEEGGGIARRLREQLTAQRPMVVNAAINGARTALLLRQLRDPLRSGHLREADVVVLSIGGNDLFGDSYARFFALAWPDHTIQKGIQRVDGVVTAIRRANPAAQVVLLGLYNPYMTTALGPRLTEYVNRWNGRLLVHFAGEPRLTVIPIADLFPAAARLSAIDRFHPGSAGYTLVAERVAALVRTIPRF